MSHVRRFDHVGLTVADLDVVTAFFVALGLEVEGRTFVEGEFLDTVCGILDSRTEIVMLKPPDGGTRLELARFVRPDSVPGSPAAMANELGLRNVSFEVNDLRAAVEWAATEGYGLVGGIGEYEGSWRMAYVRGRKGSSSRWPSAPAEPRNAYTCRKSIDLRERLWVSRSPPRQDRGQVREGVGWSWRWRRFAVVVGPSATVLIRQLAPAPIR
jgi:catechol 2,3-dioxygenase-like lactoylglutathione lyase family enzyme